MIRRTSFASDILPRARASCRGAEDMATRAMRCIGVALCDAPSRARCGDAKTDARRARGDAKTDARRARGDAVRDRWVFAAR